MKFFYSLFLSALTYSAYSQAPSIQWQNTIGGSSQDLLMTSDNTSDGGVILAGGSSSGISGDKTQNAIGGYDFWIVKLDVAGEIQWQKRYGGLADDIANSIQQTLEGGYIVAGYSGSGIGGDKTEALIGEYDFWVIKLDSAGNLLWQNTIGGIKNDQAEVVRQTNDLGYIVGGFSHSPISGDKTEHNKGAATTSDYWVVKLNSSGTVIWDNTIGGDYYDYFFALEQTWDGGYILGGYSQSGITGDKTEALIGSSDFWILKLNGAGNIQWQNTIGGTGSESVRKIVLADDGGYLLAGFSTSDISGDKTEIAYGIGTDYWVVKINSGGAIIWQNDIGGMDDDLLMSAEKATDGGYILGGVSYSGLSGDKTENSMGGGDYWVVKIDDSGNLEWQNAIGGSTSDEGRTITQTLDGGFVMSGFSESDISGDKTESNIGPADTYDYWAVKLYNECIPVPEICNTFDDDCNGLIDDAITETITISADGPTVFCQGGSVTLNAIYSGTSVQWKRNGNSIPGAIASSYTVVQKGNYTCETSSACGTTLSSPIPVNINKNPTANISPGGPITFCEGGSVVLSVTPVAGCTYQWYKGATPIVGATTTSYIATTTGNYKCRVTKTATGCFKNSNSIAVSVPCREGDIPDQENSFSIYPNPNTGVFTLVAAVKSQNFATLQSTALEIYNYNGQLIFTKEINSSNGIINETIEIGTQPSGIYLIKLNNGDTEFIQKLIIE